MCSRKVVDSPNRYMWNVVYTTIFGVCKPQFYHSRTKVFSHLFINRLSQLQYLKGTMPFYVLSCGKTMIWSKLIYETLYDMIIQISDLVNLISPHVNRFCCFVCYHVLILPSTMALNGWDLFSNLEKMVHVLGFSTFFL